ncbi:MULTISPECIES: putative toxin-antitoxin system toxin component, PIN family [Thiorhodovibrio]|uniref:putative toxin-antitoxin system toxin component, PIN family n=1 Tax=Thiorhodovibrio TaxID=61593 RepID=UPI001912790A|nr:MULTISPECIES: putative toxin-antitoxin system toxin component, PIN family [Thiorhodovibrio]MBK5970403.1 putative toxin-antitoxin system toxin component, PIN family [Thiorhodovibrio winogradskyi]
MKIVIDTSVLVAALRSRVGASHALLRSLPDPRFRIALSVTLYTEWQAVLTRPEHMPTDVTPAQVLAFLRYLASIAHRQDIYYLWRPVLRDPNDDMVLECAMASGSRFIVTHNLSDFRRAESFSIQAVTPAQFLDFLEAPIT